ncbi:hypothetical protein ON010_g13514 [Phytophthora cinnamomi]|nr:hypothetical protein ON010_g13514 [Phytophthora cinnamomi]
MIVARFRINTQYGIVVVCVRVTRPTDHFSDGTSRVPEFTRFILPHKFVGGELVASSRHDQLSRNKKADITHHKARVQAGGQDTATPTTFCGDGADVATGVALGVAGLSAPALVVQRQRLAPAWHAAPETQAGAAPAGRPRAGDRPGHGQLNLRAAARQPQGAGACGGVRPAHGGATQAPVPGRDRVRQPRAGTLGLRGLPLRSGGGDGAAGQEVRRLRGQHPVPVVVARGVQALELHAPLPDHVQVRRAAGAGGVCAASVGAAGQQELQSPERQHGAGRRCGLEGDQTHAAGGDDACAASGRTVLPEVRRAVEAVLRAQEQDAESAVARQDGEVAHQAVTDRVEAALEASGLTSNRAVKVSVGEFMQLMQELHERGVDLRPSATRHFRD